MYSIDKALFYRATGTEFYSDVGFKFRQLAIKSLNKVLAETQSLNNSDLFDCVHRVKGITLACGVSDAAYVCKKLEQYSDLMCHAKVNEQLIKVIVSVIELYESESL
ncbi:hypothetical protein [Vibrio coralliirubri]|uniref:hypothetical protein n=1 Tax=Vibrio coralliirubri TaxID=1516159 RepID=UPI000A3C4C3B|nr:hypothetical protein [Vibrio coralliirubri]